MKYENIKSDKDAQLKKMIEFEKERQFTRFSTLYYKRIYNNAEINDFNGRDILLSLKLHVANV